MAIERQKKPKGWTSAYVPVKVFYEWLEVPGLEQHLKATKVSYGLGEDGVIMMLAGEVCAGSQEIWFHPIAANHFGVWYAKRISSGRSPVMYGTIYAAFYDNDLCKVGMSFDVADSRLASHDSVMGLTGAKPIEHIVMECKTKARSVESRLIAFMEDRYEQRSREWFLGADIEVVRRAMEDSIEEDLRKWCHSASVMR